MRKKQLPKRIEILRKAFENKWSLEAVNKELEDNLCERLYARNIYEAGLIYAFCLGFDYENWKQLYTAYEEERKDARDYIQSPEKHIKKNKKIRKNVFKVLNKIWLPHMRKKECHLIAESGQEK